MKIAFVRNCNVARERDNDSPNLVIDYRRLPHIRNQFKYRTIRTHSKSFTILHFLLL